MKRVLVLGAGLIAGPLVRYLLGRRLEVTVADVDPGKAHALVADSPHGRAQRLDARDEGLLHAAVERAELLVSLLPAPEHVRVARHCLELRRPLVTTSYVSPEMRSLDAEAKRRQVLLLNEIGLDPGIDHLSAARLIESVRLRGGAVTALATWCGGLPAAECRSNPFRYKFSWSPKTAIAAVRHPAAFLRDGEVVSVPPGGLVDAKGSVEVPGLGRFECYPNRDSTPYARLYGIEGTVRDLVRGTLRYPGYLELLDGFARLGLLEDAPPEELEGSCRGYLERRLGGPARETIAERLGERSATVLPALEYLGLLEDAPIGIARGTPLDVLAWSMSRKLAYGPGERDLVVMRQDLDARFGDGHTERLTRVLKLEGAAGGETAMARTASLPAAIAACLILEGAVPEVGVRLPMLPGLVGPVLDELGRLGISLAPVER